MKPLHAEYFGPGRRILDVTRMNVESSPYPDHYLASQRFYVLRHKLFLFRRTQPDPDDVWVETGQLFLQLCLLNYRQRAKRWRIRACDSNARVSLNEILL